MTGRSPAVAPPAAVFFYSRDRTGKHPERHLQGYGGEDIPYHDQKATGSNNPHTRINSPFRMEGVFTQCVIKSDTELFNHRNENCILVFKMLQNDFDFFLRFDVHL
jgi:hypothetical protein